MKILHLATHEGVYRGGAVQLCRMALTQKKLGHRVHVIANLTHRYSRDRIDGHRSSWEALDAADIPVRQMRYGTTWGLIQLRRILQWERYDIVHAHRDDALLAVLRAGWGLKNLRLVAQRGTINPPPRNVARAFRSPRLGAAVAVADAVKQALIDDAGIEPQKIHTVYGSVDLETFSPMPPKTALRGQLGLAEDTPLIGSLSSWRKAKGFDVLIKALRDVFQIHPEARALFLGLGMAKHVEPMAKKFGIDRQCHFLKHQQCVADWLSIMDFSVIAAVGREGLSGVLRESLAMEIPVISTDCAGNGEIIEDRRTGLLVPMNDVDALAKAMCWALEHPAEMKAMARAGRRWVVDRCSMDRQAERLLETYRLVMKQ